MSALPEVMPIDDPRCRHQFWAMWGDDAEGDSAHLAFWRTKDRIILKGMTANSKVRGRTMLEWLNRHGMPVHVVEVIPSAMSYWDKVMREGLIVDWEPSDGFPSPLEKKAVAWKGIAT
jgi:hypothetical protein